MVNKYIIVQHTNHRFDYIGYERSVVSVCLQSELWLIETRLSCL